jgi:hypothetical protein
MSINKLTFLLKLILNIINRAHQIKDFALASTFNNLNLNNEVSSIIYSIIAITLRSLLTQSIIRIIFRVKFVKTLNYSIE